MTSIKDTLEERGSKYGPMERNADLTMKLMACVLEAPGGENLSNMHEECIHMIFHKISRMVNGDCMYADNAHDIVGYGKLLEDWINEKKQIGTKRPDNV